MNGLEHAAEAERLGDAYREAWKLVETMPLDSANDFERRLIAADGARQLLNLAGLHATLAQAAASSHDDRLNDALRALYEAIYHVHDDGIRWLQDSPQAVTIAYSRVSRILRPPRLQEASDG